MMLSAPALSIAEAFTITVPKDLYVVEYGSNVTLECEFPVEKQLDLHSLVVYWEMQGKNIIQLVNGKEDLKVQHSSYSRRTRLLKDQLPKGNAALQITDVKLQDAGVYCCMISYGGADYKRITLKVTAPYHKINKRISMDSITSEYELTCEAEGYPKAEVIWTNSDHQILSSKTTTTNSEREELFFNVTSTLRINTTAGEIFYCTFHGSDLETNSTAELIIPVNIANRTTTSGSRVHSNRTTLVAWVFMDCSLEDFFGPAENQNKRSPENLGKSRGGLIVET
ncbi:Programmed cell death 1 ligand 1 [Tupaia chinensis]|uniref:Programmed cell death 1 ligand 1 n=1 Tax=Tupaia chinensis TaxID=246437 RepID=L9KKR1_TUPCH|nr:Programmed cell death 1 ligand 1 [Tupaia chinensis]